MISLPNIETANSPRLKFLYLVTPFNSFDATKILMNNLQNQTTILLIESNSGWLANVYSVLLEAGYDVLIASGGDEGFCVARRVRPDLIISEVILPDISGVQLCYMIRADKDLHTIPYILIGEAGSQDGDNAVQGFRAGADDYFEESCSRQFLAAKIARLIALQRSEAELRQRCRNLRRSERNLTKIIEDTSHLAAALDPTFRLAVFDEYYVRESQKFFGKSIKPKNPRRKKIADALENWKQALQPKDFIETNKFGNGKREKVYYEIVC